MLCIGLTPFHSKDWFNRHAEKLTFGANQHPCVAFLCFAPVPALPTPQTGLELSGRGR